MRNMNNTDYNQLLEKYLAATIQKEASDLHLTAGYPPIIRVNGELWALPKEPYLTARDSQGLAFALMNAEQQNQFLEIKRLIFLVLIKIKSVFG